MIKSILKKGLFIYRYLANIFLIYLYFNNGRKPYSRGYLNYHQKYLQKVITNNNSMQSFQKSQKLPLLYGERLDERVVEYPWALSHLCFAEGRLFDAGSALNYDFILEHEKLKNKEISIFTLAPEGNCYCRKKISYIFGDLREIPYKDNWFDIIVSISTLEHVGMNNSIYSKDDKYREQNKEDYLLVISELKRVLKKNGLLLLTVPFGKYQNFGWYQQFNAIMIQNVIDKFMPTTKNETYFHYSNNGWNFSNQDDCSTAEGFDIHSTKYFNPQSDKDYDSDYAACSRAIAALELIK